MMEKRRILTSEEKEKLRQQWPKCYICEEDFEGYDESEIECENRQEELKNKLARIMQQVRRMFDIGDDIPDFKIYEALYVLQEDGLIPAKTIV